MLVQNRITAQCRIKNTNAEETLEEQQHHRDTYNGCCEYLHNAHRVHAPGKERKTIPGQAWCAHFVNGYNEVDPGKDRSKSRNKHSGSEEEHRSIPLAGIRRVEGPTGIHVTNKQADQDERATCQVDVITCKVEPGKSYVGCTQMHWQHKVTQYSRNRWHKEQEYHHNTVHGEYLIVRVGLHDRRALGEELDTYQERKGTTNQKHDGQRYTVHQANTLVVYGGKPGPNTFIMIQVMLGYM